MCVCITLRAHSHTNYRWVFRPSVRPSVCDRRAAVHARARNYALGNRFEFRIRTGAQSGSAAASAATVCRCGLSRVCVGVRTHARTQSSRNKYTRPRRCDDDDDDDKRDDELCGGRTRDYIFPAAHARKTRCASGAASGEWWCRRGECAPIDAAACGPVRPRGLRFGCHPQMERVIQPNIKTKTTRSGGGFR